MNESRKSLQRAGSVLLLCIVLAGCAGNPKPPSAELQQQIESARTRADHEALAAHYDRQADAARTSAAEHRQMAKTYALMIGIGRSAASIPAHCEALVTKYEGIAADYERIASDHRRMGENAKP